MELVVNNETPNETPDAPKPVAFVAVPRAVAADYWHQPWVDVVAAAERGDDGLMCCDATSSQPDVAFLHEGHGTFTGRTTLRQQNW